MTTGKKLPSNSTHSLGQMLTMVQKTGPLLRFQKLPTQHIWSNIKQILAQNTAI